MQVLVRDNNVDQALKALKKEDAARGRLPRDETPRPLRKKLSERRVWERRKPSVSARKLCRKKLQREGLLPMKPRVVPGSPGRSGPARAPRF